MAVCVSYLNELEQPATVSGTSLLLDGNALRLVLKDEFLTTETSLFSHDGLWLLPEEEAIVSDSAKTQRRLGIRNDDDSPLVLTNEQGDIVGESTGLQIHTPSGSLEIVDKTMEVLAIWLGSSQSWWKNGDDLGKRLRIALAAPALEPWADFVPLMRGRLSSLAECSLVANRARSY